ncbi:MAG: dTMP kinase [Calditrichia bacterium]
MKQSRFISFEGLDFCGKTTQIKLLLDRLAALKIDVNLLREPGGTAVSERVRDIVLDPAHPEMDDRTEILLYSAARAQLVHQKLIPLLDHNAYVVADRFFDSTSAYQGFGRGLDMDFVQRLNLFATSGIMPDKTLFIDISPEESVRRRRSAGRMADRLESQAIEFYHTIRSGFHQIADNNPERFIVIPGEENIDVISQRIWSTVSKIWGLGE